jgi:cell fate regulator YaaT (PSP1 superfamily)
MSKFVKVQFNPWDQRSYTYASDGHKCAVGDKVKVETKRGETIVEVVGLTDEQPPFECKPILGKHIPEETENAR